MANGADDPHNVRERVARAVDSLATSAWSIQHRLESAGVELAPLWAQEFTDPDGRRLYDEIWAALTRVKGDQGSIAASTAQLRDEEAAEVARKIVMLDFVYRPL